MNRNFKWLIFLILFVVCFVVLPVFADQPPDPGGGPGGGDDPVGGGSPVGSGLIYLIIMSGIYGFNQIRLSVWKTKK